jgi:putative Mg2+ transporter-C (MgtC) family protein
MQADPTQLDALAHTLGPGTIALRMVLATGLGPIVGIERGLADKPADTRTMALVSAGACGFILLGVQLAAEVQPGTGHQLDPARVLSYLISGVGFLGAGAILHSKKTVSGLTTAAAIWASAALGAACGLGSYLVAGSLFIVLWVPTIRYLPEINDADENHRRQPTSK